MVTGLHNYLQKARIVLTPEQRYEARMAMRGRTSDSAEDHPDGGSGSRFEVYEEHCPACGHPLHGIHRVHPNGSVDPRAVSYDDDPNEAEEVADKKSAEAAYKSQAACPCCGDKTCDCASDCDHCDCNRPLKKSGVDTNIKEHGVMVALRLDPKVARSLVIPGGDTPDQLHVTMGYFGKDNDLSQAQKNKLVNISQHLANDISWTELQGRISGLGYFQKPGEDTEVLYASVDVPGLTALYEWLRHHCRAAGLPLSEEHGFVPHITLKYQPKGSPRPKRTTPLPELTFTPYSLICKIGTFALAYAPGDVVCPTCGYEDCRCIEMADITKSFRAYRQHKT